MTDQLALGAARHGILATDTGTIATLSAGTAGGPAVLLVPGFTGSKEDFAPLLDPLAARGFHVTAIDLPGQFESPGPEDAAAYTPARLGAALPGIAAVLSPQVHLVGHSFGGLVARAAVIARPTAFASVALMSSGPSALGGRRREHIELLAPIFADGGLEAVYEASLALDASDPTHVAPGPQLAAFLRRRFLAGVPAMLSGMADALCNEPDRVVELAATRVPSLVVYGTDDDAWPPAIQQGVAARLGASQVVIAGAAHSPAIENPAATTDALVSFWRAHCDHVTLYR
jgi:pimeloyl-ACP methyl ester carboxylesterase